MDSCALEASVAYEDLVERVLHAYRDDSQNYPWIVGFSGGKDSTLVAHLVFDAVMQVAPRRRNRQIYFVSNDTLVESPFVTRQVQEQFDMVQCAADCFSLPITTVITRPKLEHTFWVLLIGKGYPCPNQKMRWCTDRLKIKPVLHVDSEGRLIARSKVRGRMQALRAIAMKFGELEADKDQMIFISHGDCEKDAMVVKETLVKEFGCDPERIVLSAVGPVIGSHSGPGTVALFFRGKDRG